MKLNGTRISIPLLITELHKCSKITKGKQLRVSFLDYNDRAILSGDEVDKQEDDILTKCKTISVKEVRKNSYANILYVKIRSAYVHEGKPGPQAESLKIFRTQKEDISYPVINCERHIYFNINLISKLAISIAEHVDKAENTMPYQKPGRWWIHG